MYNWLNFEQVLIEQDIPKKDIGFVREFLSALPFKIRQEIFGVFLNFPGKLNFFIDILKNKKELAKNFAPELAQQLLKKELKEIENIKNE